MNPPSSSHRPWWEGDYVWRPPEEPSPPPDSSEPAQPPPVLEPVDPPAHRARPVRYLVRCWCCRRRFEDDEDTCPYCGAPCDGEDEPRRPVRPVSLTRASAILPMIWFYLAMMGVSILQVIVALILSHGDVPTDNVSLSAAIFAEVVDAILVLTALFTLPKPPAWPEVSPGLQGLAWVSALPVLAVLLAANFTYHHVLRTVLGGAEGGDDTFGLGKTSPLFILIICVQPAIIEELFFRQVALGTLRRTMTLHMAVLVSSIMFGVAHLGAPLSMPLLSMLGAGFAYVRIWSRSIIPPMIMHFLHNLAVVMLASS